MNLIKILKNNRSLRQFDLQDIELDFILENVCEILDVKSNVLKSKNRMNVIAYARFCYYYSAKLLTNYSLKLIGYKVNRNHATVIYGLKQFNNKYNKELQNHIKIIKEKFINKYN